MIDAVAGATLVLALVTVAAIVVPICRENLNGQAQDIYVVSEASALLKAIDNSLKAAIESPNLDASAGVDVISQRLLSADVINALEPMLALELVNTIMVALRALNNADIRTNTVLLNVGVVQQQADTARVRIAALEAELRSYLLSMPGIGRISRRDRKRTGVLRRSRGPKRGVPSAPT